MDINNELQILIDSTTFSNNVSVKKFYKKITELLIKETPSDFLNNNFVLKGSERLSLLEFLKSESSNKKSLYIHKIIFMDKKAPFSSINFLNGVFFPFLKESVSNRISKENSILYKDLLSKRNINLMVNDKQVFKGVKNINKLLKIFTLVEDFSIFEKNLNDPEVMETFFSYLSVNHLKKITKSPVENFLNILRAYPKIWSEKVENSKKKIPYVNQMKIVQPYLYYMIMSMQEDNNQRHIKFINEYMKKTLNVLSDEEIYTINKNDFVDSIDFRLVQEKEGWKDIKLKNGQDLFSIYCLAQNLKAEDLEKWKKEEDFLNFLKNREENFLIDVTRNNMNFQLFFKVLEEYPFLSHKKSEGFIFKNWFDNLSNYKNKIVVDVSVFSSNISKELIFGSFEQQKKYFNDFNISNNNFYKVNEASSSGVIKEMYKYNKTQPNGDYQNLYIEFFFSLINLYKQKINKISNVHEEVNKSITLLKALDLQIEDLNQLKIFGKVSEIEVVFLSYLENKKIWDSVIEVKSENKISKKRL